MRTGMIPVLVLIAEMVTSIETQEDWRSNRSLRVAHDSLKLAQYFCKVARAELQVYQTSGKLHLYNP